MIVYGTCISPFVRKVLFVLAEKGLTAEQVKLFPHAEHPAFLEASPFGLLPGFRDGDLKLADSSVICHYLERKHPTPALVPTDLADYARTLWFEEVADSMLFSIVQKVFGNLVVKPKLLGLEPNMDEVAAGLAAIPTVFGYLESQINGPYLVADRLTLADIAVSCHFVNLAMAGHGIDAAQYPKLAAYVAGIHARPTFQSIKDPE